MGTKPSIMTRLRAAVKSEVPAGDLAAYQNAGQSVYGLLDAIQQRRLEMLLAGTNPWNVDAATQIQLFAGWQAFALQTLGDVFVEADYAADPGTVGYVPEVTMQQAMLFYAEIGSWVSISREAAANEAYRHSVTATVALPDWAEVEPCPRAHLAAMVTTANKLGMRTEAFMADIRQAQLTADQMKQLKRVEQLLVRGNTYRERAEQLYSYKDKVSDELHEQVETNVKEAIEAFFDAGQLLAMPALIKSYDDQSTRPDTRVTLDNSLSVPGHRGFDMWCLTDPATRRDWQDDPAAERAIEMLWKYDPDPAATLRIQSEIDNAVRKGDVVFNQQGNYFCCPWSAIYQVVNPVRIGGQSMRRGQTFTFDVSAEEIAEGGEFKREILIANFTTTNKVDYCNPDEGGHDDD